jgi:hypothetical protein
MASQSNGAGFIVQVSIPVPHKTATIKAKSNNPVNNPFVKLIKTPFSLFTNKNVNKVATRACAGRGQGDGNIAATAPIPYRQAIHNTQNNKHRIIVFI